MARRAASMLVAFESLTNRTPPISRDRLERVLEAGESFDRARHRRGFDAGERRHRRRGEHVRDQVPAEQPDRRRAAPAARALTPCARTIVSPSTTTPSERSLLIENSNCRARGRPRQRERRRIVGVQHRPVVGGLLREDARLRGARTRRRSRAGRDDRAKNSAAPRSTDGTCRSPSSWKLLASTT